MAGTAAFSEAASDAPLPAHVYAPYYETFLAPHTPSLTMTARESGAQYFTLAFLQSTGQHSCSLAWNGRSGWSVGSYAADIAQLRAAGGDVIPSFGGWSADQGGTEIADSCPSISRIAAAYESVITTLGVTRLDMDIEGSSLNNSAGIDRRNKAIAMTEAWAARRGIPLQIQYTLPVQQYGLPPGEEAVLQNAVTDRAAVQSVNILVFDYFASGEGTVNMGQAAINAAMSTYAQLAALYPALTLAQVWNTEAMTILPGIDDYRKSAEITYLSDAQAVLSFAQAHGMNYLSSWSIQRDNGGCPGIPDRVCSGIAQNTWDFSHLLAPFTG